MMYPSGILELDKYPDDVLKRELERRRIERNSGKCSYCLRPFDDKNPCRLHEKRVGTSGDDVVVERVK